MHVEIAFNFKLVEGSTFEFSQPLAPVVITPELAGEKVAESPDTPVLPLGSSTIAPGLTMVVGV